MRSSSPLFLLTCIGFLIWAGCSEGLGLLVSNPCDPAYTGDQVCPSYVVDTGVEHEDGGGLDGDINGTDGGGGGDEPDSGFCLCTGVSDCCDGCHPVGEGELCDTGFLPCAEHRCSPAGVCELMVVDGWCLVEGVCHNTDSDPLHCGACGNDCGESQVCFEGACASGCPVHYTDCDGRCFELDVDPLNCGTCGQECLPGEQCQDGSCVGVCPLELTHCAGVCVDLESDPQHCGECSVKCSGSQVCAGGECVDDCYEGQVDCDGACVFLGSNRLHCGECGYRCQGEQVCVEGACVFPCDSGLTDCGGSCVSLMSDWGNCGECGLVCPPNGSCVDGECLVPVTGVSLTLAELNLAVGQFEQLVAVVAPENATDQSLIWTSSAPGVVAVSDGGLVTGAGPGAGVITVTTVDGGLVADCSVTVIVPAAGVSISPPALSLLPGEGGTLTAVFIPVDATDQSVIWETSDPGVVTVSGSGEVEGVEPGNAIVTVTAVDGAHQAHCEVTVVATQVTGISITPPAITIGKGTGGLQLQVIIEPVDASDQRVLWSSSDERVVVVNDSGVITGVAGGEATVTVTSLSGGKQGDCAVTVRVPVTGITVTPESLIIPPGAEGQLTGVVSPPDASDQRITWTSSNETIATVSGDGLVTGHQAGDLTVTAQTTDGNHIASVGVRVGIPVTGVEVEPVTLSLMPGDTDLVTAAVFPPDATEPEVVWASSNGAVATVDEGGVVTGVSGGETVITATTVDGEFVGSCTVSVGTTVTGVTLTPSSLVVPPGAQGKLTAAVIPASATDKGVAWTSSDLSVATVSSTGVVTGHSTGQVTVTVQTNDGGYTATARVRVGIPVTGVEVEPGALFLILGDTGLVTAAVLPPDATEPEVVWVSSNETVATVDDGGVVTGVGVGTAAITVTTCDGGFMDSAQVTVTLVPSGYEFIQEGTFIMGSPEGEFGQQHDETQHQVTITRPFLMKATQVTQGEWEAVKGDNPSHFNSCSLNCPVEMVTWDMALDYANALSGTEGLPQCFECEGSGVGLVCNLKAQYTRPQECPGYRLPTEAEWEYAARAGSTAAFHTDSQDGLPRDVYMKKAGWYKGNSSNKTKSVAGKAVNNWGLYDMHGNVWEWIWDRYQLLGAAPLTDPHGASTGSTRVLRGGSCLDIADYCRAAHRFSRAPSSYSKTTGFRLARSL